MYNWHITLFIIFDKYACADLGSGVQPPPLKISNFLNYIVKLSKKRSWTPLPPGRDRYPSNPPSWKKILDPCMIYLFYVLMVYFYWSVTFMSSIHLFLPINAVHISNTLMTPCLFM